MIFLQKYTQIVNTILAILLVYSVIEVLGIIEIFRPGGEYEWRSLCIKKLWE